MWYCYVFNPAGIFLNHHTSVKAYQINTIIKNLPRKKASRAYYITNTELELLPPSKILSHTKIYYMRLSIDFLLSYSIKNTIIIIKPKPDKDLKASTSYRSITLLLSISKLFKLVILNPLHHHYSISIRKKIYAF